MDNDDSSSNARLPRSVPRLQRPIRQPRSQRARQTQRSQPYQPPQRPQPQPQPPDDRPSSRPGSRPGGRPGNAAASSTAVTRKVRAVLSKKLKFYTEIMTHLDMLIYAEMCTLYYMECSLFRLLLRALPQSLFFSPKSEEFMLITPAQRPHVLAIFVPNVLCILYHLLGHTPQGTEASRGYLNGGVLIDFVGQRAPSSRWTLIFFDFVILAIQCLMLAVHTQRERLRKQFLPMKGSLAVQAGSPEAAVLASGAVRNTNLTPNQALTAAASSVIAARRAAAQDHDAEERGVLRAEGDESIEMQQLSGDDSSDDSSEEDENENLNENNNENESSLDSDTWGPRRLSPEEQAQKDLDELASGCNLADFYVVHAIKEAGGDYQGVAAQSMQTVGYATSIARMAALRSLRTPAPRPGQT